MGVGGERMNAEDTVMNDEAIRATLRSINAEMVNRIMDDTVYAKVYPEDREIAKAQAEISFKAGREDRNEYGERRYVAGIRRGEDNARQAICDARQAGIKEVVEWLNNYFMGEPWMTEDDVEWQAQLKEWGTVYKQVGRGDK